MSRTAAVLYLGLIGLALPSARAAVAQPGAGEQAIAEQQSAVRSVVRRDCRRPGADGGEEEIVVCGRREQDARHRLPLAVAEPPTPADRAGGEQLTAMSAGDDRCSPVGRAQRCNGGLDVIGIGFIIARAIAQARARRD